MRKILFIGSVPPPYHGVTVQNKRLLDSKLSAAFDLIHLDTTDKRDLNNLGKFDPGNVWLGIKHLFLLIYLVIKSKPDILYLTVAQNTVAYLRDGLFIIIGKLLSKTKVVIHFRGGNYFNFYSSSSLFLRKFMDSVYGMADFGIVLGSALKGMISTWFDDDHTFVIPNGSAFRVDISQRKSPNKEINVGYIGFLAPEKGTFELLNIFEQLYDDYPHINLKLAGEFAYGNEAFKKEFLQRIEKSRCAANIHLLGKIIDGHKKDFFLNTDIFAFPSWIEGHPNAVLEAMAAGCPIVATDVGAVSESVIDGYNGFLLPAKTEKLFREKVELLINNPALRAEMGKHSHLLFKEKFTSEANIEKMISAFNLIGVS